MYLGLTLTFEIYVSSVSYGLDDAKEKEKIFVDRASLEYEVGSFHFHHSVAGSFGTSLSDQVFLFSHRRERDRKLFTLELTTLL